MTNDVKYKWTSVNDMLPGDGTYLVCKDFGIHVGLFITTASFCKDGNKVCKYDLKDKKDVFYHLDRDIGYVTTEVTHWMPLPEPPDYY